MARIRLGTRGSKLALIQSRLVINELQKIDSTIDVEIVIIQTMGDNMKNPQTTMFGRHKELFSSEINEKLMMHEIDIAMHSVKDLGVHLPENLILAAVLEREDPFDAFVSNIGENIESLPDESIIGTSSIRRQLFIKKFFPQLKVVNFRGNIDTRLQKLNNNEVDAAIIAVSALKRIGLNQSFSVMNTGTMVPAPGQGAICVVARENNRPIIHLLSQISHKQTMDDITCERAFVKEFGGNCQTPLGALARTTSGRIKLECAFFQEINENIELISTTVDGSISDPTGLGRIAAKKMKEQIQTDTIPIPSTT